MAAPNPFRSPLLGEDPIAREVRVKARRDSWRKLVLKRQRILKAQGFNVPTDGNWGKRTSSAWWRHNRGLPPLGGRKLPKPVAALPMGEGAAAKARIATPGHLTPTSPTLAQRAAARARKAAEGIHDRPAVVDMSHASAKALAAAPRRPRDVPDRGQVPVPRMLDRIPTREQTRATAAAVKMEIEKQAQVRFKKAWDKRYRPDKWDSRDIVALFADPTTRVKDWYQKKEWVERLQVWLQASGQSVVLTGTWDAQTSDGLQAEMQRRARNYQRWRATQLAKHIYTPLKIKPGDKGFPLLGTAPTPEKLLQLADQGGMTAEAVFAELGKRFLNLQMQSSWRAFQNEQLNALLVGGEGVAQAASAFGPFLTPLQLSMMSPTQKYAAILLGYSSQFEQTPDTIDGGASVENDSKKKGDTFFQQVQALAQSTDADDLKRRIRQVSIADEKLFQFEQATKAMDDNFFFNGGKAVFHALTVPAEWTQDQLASLYGFGTALLDSETRRIALEGILTGDTDTLKNVQVQLDRGAALGRANWAQWEKDHPVYGFIVDLVADPLNLIPASWVGDVWKASKFGVKALNRAGEVTQLATATKPLPLRLVGETTGTALKLPAAYGLGARAGLKSFKVSVQHSKVGRVNRAVRESVDDVTRTVNVAFRHGFAPAAANDPADVAKIKDDLRAMLKGVQATDPTTGRKFNVLDEIEKFGVGSIDEMTGFFGDLVTLASKQRLSLYAHTSRETLSDFGRAIEGTLGSFLYSMHADKYAGKLAKKESDRVLDELVNAYFRPGGARRKVPHHIPTIREPILVDVPDDELLDQLTSIARNRGETVYKEALARAGTYLGGGSFEVMKMLEGQALDSLGLWHDTILPALQSAIERSLHGHEVDLVQSGVRPSTWEPVGLFTKSGYAIGNRAKASTALRDLLRNSFDDLDETFGPSAAVAQRTKAVANFRKQRTAEIRDEFALREEALRERTTSFRSQTDEMRQRTFGEKLAVLKRDNGVDLNTPIREGETLAQAAQRFADENGLDLSKFNVEEGHSVRVVPVLISKRDPKTVIWGDDAARLLAERSPKLKDYYLAEARVGPDKVESLSNEIVDLGTGELTFDVPQLDEQGNAVFRTERGEKTKREPSPKQDPKFRKAQADLDRINKQIAERRQGPKSPERDAELARLQKAKRNLLKRNPAVQTYLVRGSAKRALTARLKSSLNREVGDIDTELKALQAQRAEKLAQVEDETRDFAASLADTRKRSDVVIENADFERVFTQDEYDEFLGMMIERRSRSVAQWAARRRAVGDASDDAIARAVDNALEEEATKLKGWFKDQGDGTFKMTQRTIRVNALYARHHLGAYRDALAGRHPILTAEDVPVDIRRVLSLGATPADRAPGAVQSVERMAALISGARPYPVWKKFGTKPEEAGAVVKGRTVTFERSAPNRVGVAAGTRMANDLATWNKRLQEIKRAGWGYRDYGGGEPTDFVGRYDAYRAALKVASEHAYSRISLRQGAWIRALQEAQSGPLVEINNLLGNFRELYVFSVLPARVGSVVRNVLDSVAKMLVAGFVDPRYWFIRGVYTLGEQEARKKLSAVSSDFLHASFPTEMRVLNAAKGFFDNQALVQQRVEDTLAGKITKEAGEFLGEQITNVFQVGVKELEQALRLMVGPKYADAMAVRLRHIFNTAFWGRPLSEIRKTLQVNGIYQVPDEVIFGVQTILRDGVAKHQMPREAMTLEDWAALNRIGKDDVRQFIDDVTANPELLNNTRNPVNVMLSHTADVMWDLMVGRPEGWLRRGLYNAAYTKAVRKGADATRAHVEAMEAIDKTLFDYSKMTTLDENLKHLAPFVFFWRRNLGFWITESIRKPYLPAAVSKFEEMLDLQNEQDPAWSRRYIRIPFLNDALSKLPIAKALLPGGGNYELGLDPMTYLSAAPLYRAFAGENPMLPADRKGVPFLSALIDGMNDFGLAMSPWARKPLELAGVFNYRAWQTMFPQTGLIDAWTDNFLHDLFPGGLNFEEVLQDSLFDAVGASLNAGELNQKRVDELVQLEVAAQAERGEPLDRPAAEKKVREFFYVQSVIAFSAGAYLRHLDPAVLHLYNIQQQLVDEEIDFLDLSPEEQRAYRIFVKRKLNPGAFNAYLQALPKIEAFYAMEDYDEGQRFLQENPELIPHVTPQWRGRPLYKTNKALRTAALVADTGAAIAASKAFDRLDFDDAGVKDRVRGVFVTPELEAFWAQNDTPAQQRDKMLRGEVYHYLRDLRNDYFAIPDKDHDGKAAFLRDNPLLAHSFTVNDEASDDLRDVLNYVNSDLREVYFEHLDRKDFKGAAEFLKRFPRMFELTKAENRVTDDGTWLPSKKGSQHAKDYLAAKPHIEHYFALKEKNKKLAYRWLDGNTPGAKLVRRYFQLYGDATKGKRSEHAKAYVAMKPLLTWFFDSIKDKGEFRGHYSKWDWVFNSNDPAAQKLRAYFRKYGDKAGMSQHAKDYVAVKDEMQRYFKLKETDPEAANRFLHSDAGKGVLAYFKKYGKTNAAARKWGKWVRSQNPEVNRRLVFWKRYFELEPDQRPGFAHREAENYGVFIWGLEEERARHEKEQSYVRAAKKRHLTEKQGMYLKVKPLLELMHGLDDRDTKILLRLNPDIREYLDKFGSGPHTGDKKLDAKVETYFKLEPDSLERAAFLRSNPEVQDYFDKKNPADAAMHNLLEVYFAIESPKERNQFRDLHPELSDYFDRKREEKSNLRAELQAFDDADPRLDPLFERASTEIVHAAEVMWARLRGDMATRLAGDDLQVRRTRDPERVKTRRSSL